MTSIKPRRFEQSDWHGFADCEHFSNGHEPLITNEFPVQFDGGPTTAFIVAGGGCLELYVNTEDGDFACFQKTHEDPESPVVPEGVCNQHVRILNYLMQDEETLLDITWICRVLFGMDRVI